MRNIFCHLTVAPAIKFNAQDLGSLNQLIDAFLLRFWLNKRRCSSYA